MANDLIPDPTVLDGFPGAPFTEQQIDAAVGALRAHLGWHVAPSQADSEAFDVIGGQRELVLSTRHLVSVDEVLAPGIVDPSGYSVSHRNAIIRGSWPSGFEAVTVEYTHGYTACPPELLPVIAELATAAKDGDFTSGASVRLAEVAIGSGAASTRQDDPAVQAMQAAIAKHTVLQGFA